jgi:hypothetical protein
MLRSVLVGLIMGMVVMVVGVDTAGGRPPEGQLILDLSFEQALARDRTSVCGMPHSWSARRCTASGRGWNNRRSA